MDAAVPKLLYPALYSMRAGWVNNFVSAPRPYGSLALCTLGEGSYFADGSSFSLRPGELLFIPQGGRYLGRWWDHPSELRAVHFEMPPGRIRYFVQKIDDPAILGEACPLLEELIGCYDGRRRRPDADPCRILAQFYGLFAAVRSVLRGEERRPADERIAGAAARIEADPADSCSAAEMAAACHMSLPHFHACFKRDIGMAPIAYRQHQRIRMAQRLLLEEPSRPIGEIAGRLGFSSETYFRRTFLAQVGMPPREFRRRGFEI